MKNQEGSALIVRGQVVYVVEDEPAMREAVTTLLRSVDFDVCAFATAREFFECSRPDVPSCLILDVRLQGQSGLSVQDQIVESGIDIPIIFMTAHGDIAMTVKAMKSGAADFLAKPFRDQDLLDAVERALLTDESRRAKEHAFSRLRKRYESLTPRERDIIALVASGLQNKQIAAHLGLSEITVKVHRGHAMQKMDSRSIADFVLKAKALGVAGGNERA
ncbi:two component transcriptional regulator, LuxR family [Burkholderia sp. YR290]|jgi:FixJ family two-component response regulator|uniref:response regulator transcription factor n=1 Tax=Paraburkholderia hospita TaxID=169430 RepID=UPI0009A7DE80|nr:response regulator [Paraburkholderia hospita]SKC64711.1 two component transcriptional regulator, LuxR family [Paraburkholderia hospita]SOE65009.1 two component transcriptional regulator, LuxR family [Burkholderia sp. YR290]